MALKRAVVIFLLGLVQVFGTAAYAQTVLNFPRVISNSTLFTGLAVGNPTSSAASVTFTAFLPDGTLFAAAGGQNPATLQIPAGGQAAKVFTDLFGSGDFNGWIQATSSTPGLTGFFLNGNTAETDLDGAGAISPAAQFTLPFASEDSVAQTEITIVNVNAHAASPALTLYGLDGSVIATKGLSIAANSLVRQTLTGIFGSLDFSNASHLGVTSDLPVISHEVVANYALAGSAVRRETAALSGQQPTAATTYILPQFATGGGWLSLIGIVNASGIGQEITLTAYQDDGTVANVPNNPVKISLDGNAALRTTADQLFGFSSDSLITGWIKIQSSLGYVSSYIGYGNTATPSFAAVAGTDAASASQFSVFSQVAQGAGFYTGLTLVNPGTQPANVQFYTLRPDGTTVGQATFMVQPNQRVGSLFNQILPSSLLQVGGWAFLSSSQPVVSAVLFGTTNGDALANVPQQIPAGNFTPAPQTTAAIDGNVQAGGVPIGNVQITLSGPVMATTTTDGSGNYIFPQLPAGAYVVTAVQAGAQFVPPQQTVNVSQQNVDGVNFQAGGLTAAAVPSIQFVSPTATFTANSALSIRVLGSNFTPVSVIQLNGQSLATVFVSSTEVDGVIPGAQLANPATLQVTVQTSPPGGGVSAAVAFTVNALPSNPLIIQGSIPVGSFPAGVAIDTNHNTALVTNQSGNNVTVVDLTTFATKATIGVGRSPADGIAILPAKNIALVANPGSNSVSVIDLTTNTKTGQDITVGNFPVGVAINPTTNQAVVTNANDNNVSIIDLNTLIVLGQIGVGTRPEGVAINSTTNQAVVSNSGSDDAWVIDLGSKSILAKIPVGQFPRGVAINSTTNVAVVVNADSNSVTVIDLAHDTVLAAAMPVGTGPTDVAIHMGTNQALVTNSGVASGATNFGVSGSVSVIDLGALTTLPSTIPTGSAAFGIAVDQAGQQAVVANFGTGSITVIRIPNPIPQVGNVSPSTFPAGGGDFTITVTGTGFLPTSVVTLNGQSLPTTYVSSTELQAVVSASVLQQLIQVQSPSSVANATAGGLADSMGGGFTVGVNNRPPGGGSSPPSNSGNTHLTVQNLQPVLTSISPLQTAVSPNPFTLTLNGNNFNATSKVSFGGTLYSPSSSNGTSMTISIPAAVLQAGMYPVFVSNPPPGGGVSLTTLTFTVTAQNPAPSIASVTPATIPAGSGPATVTVQGSHFSSNAIATLGSATGSVSGNTITFSLSANDTATPTTLSGLITNPGTLSTTATFSVSVLNASPTVTSFSPTTADAGSSALPVQVNGTNFKTGTVITVEGTPLTPTQLVSSTQLTATIPASFLERSASLHIGVQNAPPGGGAAAGGVLVVSSALPTVSGANPAAATVQTTSLTVQLIGTGFAGNSVAMIGATRLTSVFGSATALNVTIPASFLSRTGTLQIVVSNPPPGGGNSTPFNYAVQNPVPVLSTVSPTTLSGDQTNAVLTLTGQKFVTGATVGVGGQTYTPTAISSTQITVPLLPPLPLGHVQVTVTNPTPGGGVSNALPIDISAQTPTITATSPSVVSAGGTLHVTGTNFGPGSMALINNATVPTIVNTTTTLDATVPSTLSPGPASLTVRNPVPSGTPLVSTAFTITIGNPVPTISSLSPASASLNQSNQQITIQGQGFIPTSQVQVAGNTVASSFVNSGTLTFTLPSLPSGNSVLIQVVNLAPGGGTAAATLLLTAALPSVSGISPSTGTAFTAVEFVVSGSNFVNGATINFGGTVINGQYLGSTELGGTVTLGNAGPVSVSVTNPGGGTSNSTTFLVTAPPVVVTPPITNNPAPSISSLSPASVTAGAATFPMTILGSNFISGTTVTFGTIHLSVTSVTSTSLMVSVPASAVTTPGNITVTVTNAAPGGGSATSTFNVLSGAPAPTALTLLPSPAFVGVGATTTVTVSVDHAPSAALSVSLSFGGANGSFSSSSSVTSTTVTIASGTTSTSTQIFGFSAGTTNLTASANGLTGATIDVDVIATISGSLSVAPSPVTLTVGSSTTIAITRPANTVGVPLTIGLSAAPAGLLSVPSSLTFLANASTITTNIGGLSVAEGVDLIVAGPDAPSLLTGRVINFLPPGVSAPATVPFQTFSSDQSTLATFGGTASSGFQAGGCVDDCAQAMTIPFQFPFYGVNHNSVFVGTNGNMTFGTPDTTFDFTGDQEFLISLPRIAAMATDLFEFPAAAGSRIFTNTVTTTSGHQAFVVVYENMGLFDRSQFGGLNTFQIVLFDSGAVQINYKVVNNATATTTSDFFVGLSPGFPSFNRPGGLWTDGTHTYVADTGNEAIRQITNATGQVITLAGNPSNDETLDGTGSNAHFFDPAGIWGDGAGNLYITESSGNTVRKLVISTGVVTTLVPGTAGLNVPNGIWGDGAGNLYVVSTGDSTIRKVVISTGSVSTFAGSGSPGANNAAGTSASFNGPMGIWGDSTGNLYVADTQNDTIRKIVISGAQVSTFAGIAGTAGQVDSGAGSPEFSTPTGVWGDGRGNLFVSEWGNEDIRKIVISSQTVSTFASSGFIDGATGSEASFSRPGLIFGDTQNIYIPDTDNNVIRQAVLSSAAVTTLAGSGESSEDSGFIDGIGTPVTNPQQTALGNSNAIPNSFIFQDFNPNFPSAEVDVPVTINAVPPPNPVLAQISPLGASKGQTNVSITLSGANLGGVTGIQFLSNGVSDASVTVSGITPSTDGTQLTASLTVLSNAVLGMHNVQLTSNSLNFGFGVPFEIFDAGSPALFTMTPVQVANGTTVPLAITGASLSSINGLAFNPLQFGASDPGIAVSGITASATTLGGTLTISGAMIGPHLVNLVSSGLSFNQFSTDAVLNVSTSAGSTVFSETPGIFPLGSSGAAFTISGADLNGVTGISFFNPDQTLETGITATVTASTSSVSASLTISSSIPVGPRRLVLSFGSSQVVTTLALVVESPVAQGAIAVGSFGPPSGMAGGSFQMNLNGTGLSGLSGFKFQNSGNDDTSMHVSGFQATGNQAVATVSIDSADTAGPRTIVLLPSAGGTLTTDLVFNVLEGPPSFTISPLGASQGQSSVAITLTGVNLAGTTNIQFFANGQNDPQITVTNVVASVDGTQVTATANVSNSASAQFHTVQITRNGPTFSGGGFEVFAAGAPALYTMTPLQVTNGTTVPFSITGASLGSINGLAFYPPNFGSSDTGITVSGMTASASALSGTLMISGALIGPHAVNLVSAGVSSHNESLTGASLNVATSTGSTVFGVVPQVMPRGSSGAAFTISGVSLSTVTGISFINPDQSLETGITVGSVTAAGSSISTTLSLSSSMTVGPRRLVLSFGTTQVVTSLTLVVETQSNQGSIYVSSFGPGSIQTGQSNPLILNGGGLSSVTGVSFLLVGSPDANLQVTSLTGGSSQLSGTLSAANAAAAGPRTMSLTTNSGTIATNLVLNVIQGPASIVLSPLTVSTVVDGTAAIGVTLSQAITTSGGVDIVMVSGNPGVATVGSPVHIAQGQTLGSAVVTGITTGSLTVSASSPGYISTNTVQVTVDLPLTLSPVASPNFSGGTLGLFGTNFNGGTTVSFNGVSGTVNSETPTSLSVTAPANLTDGSQPVFVQNTDGSVDSAEIVVLPPAVSSLSTGQITTLAGSGRIAGDAANPFTTPFSSILNAPTAVTRDAVGNLYIADSGNHRVRMVRAYDQKLVTLPFQFSSPAALTPGPGGVYVSDTGTNLVYLLTPAGTAQVVAGGGDATSAPFGDGGLAVNAALSGPRGLATDSVGNLYIADTGNNVVRVVSASTGIISAFAGSYTAGNLGDNGPATSAQLNSPVGLVFDGVDNLYIGDSQNNAIREVNSTTLHITTYAAASSLSTFGSGALAIDASSNVYAAVGSQICRADGGTCIVVAGTGASTPGYSGDGGAATSATLAYPQGLYFDRVAVPNGLLIADTDNHVIRKISSGNISTIIGNGNTGTDASAYDATLNLNPCPTEGFCAADPTQQGIAVDYAGNIHFSEHNGHQVRYVNPSLPEILLKAGTGFSGSNGSGGATTATLNYPTGLAFDASGNLYIADTKNHAIRQVTPGGNINTVAGVLGLPGSPLAGNPATSTIGTPLSVALDASGLLYFVDSGSLWKFPLGGTLTAVATLPSPLLPTAMQLDASGNVYIAAYSPSSQVYVVSPSGSVSIFAGNGQIGNSNGDGNPLNAEFVVPSGLALDDSGDVFITDAGNDNVRKVSGGGVISTIAGTVGAIGLSGDGGPASSAIFNRPAGAAVDSMGNLVIADVGNERLRLIKGVAGPPFSVSGISVSSAARGQTLTGVTITGTGFGAITGVNFDAGITATITGQTSTTITVNITVPPTAPTGFYGFTVVGPHTFVHSSPQALDVTPPT